MQQSEKKLSVAGISATITPRQPSDRGGFICMPLKQNVSEGREGWTLTMCPKCGEECWRQPGTEIAEQSGAIALCTFCALQKGLDLP